MQSRTAVITGATGFIGGALATRLLNAGWRVVALCRDGDPPKGCEVVRGELEDLRTCERLMVQHNPDVVFHLAAQAIVGVAKRDPFATMESNVRGTYNLLEAARRQIDCEFIMASSDKAYGEIPEGAEKYVESHPLAGRGYYDCSKSCADLIAQSYGDSGLMNVTIVRAGNVYGPGDRDLSRIVPSMVEDFLASRRLTILSDGTPIRDYLYVGDAVGAYMACLDKPGRRTRAFNFAGGEAVSVIELADRFKEAVAAVTRRTRSVALATRCHYWLDRIGFEHYTIKGCRKSEIQRQVLDCSKAERELLWKPEVSLTEGLQRTIMALEFRV